MLDAGEQTINYSAGNVRLIAPLGVLIIDSCYQLLISLFFRRNKQSLASCVSITYIDLSSPAATLTAAKSSSISSTLHARFKAKRLWY